MPFPLFKTEIVMLLLAVLLERNSITISCCLAEKLSCMKIMIITGSPGRFLVDDILLRKVKTKKKLRQWPHLPAILNLSSPACYDVTKIGHDILSFGIQSSISRELMHLVS